MYKFKVRALISYLLDIHFYVFLLVVSIFGTLSLADGYNYVASLLGFLVTVVIITLIQTPTDSMPNLWSRLLLFSSLAVLGLIGVSSGLFGEGKGDNAIPFLYAVILPIVRSLLERFDVFTRNNNHYQTDIEAGKLHMTELFIAGTALWPITLITELLTDQIFIRTLIIIVISLITISIYTIRFHAILTLQTSTRYFIWALCFAFAVFVVAMVVGLLYNPVKVVEIFWK